ncbi:MAG TPA: 16S rRNA (uracil(1498)-N(3))-methyltransferase [Dehalococcoidia bacterium]
MKRFHVPPGTLDADNVQLDGAVAHRMSRVLRLRAGDEAALFDGDGFEARVRLDAVDDRAVTATVLERYEGLAEPLVKVSLYQSITKGERFDWLLEKGTEIGVARFVPLITARSVIKPSDGSARVDRWHRIVVEAAEQCGRTVVPKVDAPVRIDDALAAATGVVIVPYEAAGEMALDVQRALNADIDALFALSEVSIFIGPEGGFEEAEIERATAAGAVLVTMGRRVLRSETAGLVAATLVLQAAGELG